MHIQIVNFHLKGLAEEAYLKACDELAPSYREVPGLVSKVWLADPGSNTYGGVLSWESREAMENFAKSELARGVYSHPNFADVTSKDFGVLEGPSRVTRGLTDSPARV